MKRSELKQLIREELKNALSEKKSVIWKGSRVEVVKDDGGPTLTVIKPNGREGMVFRKDTFLPLDESLNSLKDNEYNIANAIENSNIPDGEFDPYTKMGVVNFIKKGSASQSYLEEMMDILKKYDIEVELTPTTPLPDRSIEDIEDFNTILSKYLK
jgi:hypothetical protein